MISSGFKSVLENFGGFSMCSRSIPENSGYSISDSVDLKEFQKSQSSTFHKVLGAYRRVPGEFCGVSD